MSWQTGRTPAWTARSARVDCAVSTTAEIFRSEEPWLNRTNVDAGAAERAEKPRRDPGRPRHIVTDDRHDTLPILDVNVLNLAADEFVGKRLGDHPVCAPGKPIGARQYK